MQLSQKVAALALAAGFASGATFAQNIKIAYIDPLSGPLPTSARPARRNSRPSSTTSTPKVASSAARSSSWSSSTTRRARRKA